MSGQNYDTSQLPPYLNGWVLPHIGGWLSSNSLHYQISHQTRISFKPPSPYATQTCSLYPPLAPAPPRLCHSPRPHPHLYQSCPFQPRRRKWHYGQTPRSRRDYLRTHQFHSQYSLKLQYYYQLADLPYQRPLYYYSLPDQT